MSETAKTEQSAKLNSVVDTIISKIPQEREKELFLDDLVCTTEKKH